MNFLTAIFRFLFRFFFTSRRAPEIPQQPVSPGHPLNQPRLSAVPSETPGLGQMEKQVGLMAQLPLSKRTVRAKFSSVDGDGSTDLVSESDVITPDGIHAEKTHHLIVTGSGHVTKATGIIGKCGFCGQFDSTLHRCSDPICRLPLCELHAVMVEVCGEKICYCPAHALRAEETRDNWKEYWAAREGRKHASDDT